MRSITTLPTLSKNGALWFPNKTVSLLYFNAPKLNTACAALANAIDSTLCLSRNRTYGAGRPHVRLCPKVSAIFVVYIFSQQMIQMCEKKYDKMLHFLQAEWHQSCLHNVFRGDRNVLLTNLFTYDFLSLSLLFIVCRSTHRHNYTTFQAFVQKPIENQKFYLLESNFELPISNRHRSGPTD